MKRLLIVGAGGFGRELLTLALDNEECGRAWTIGGFLDSRADALNGFSADYHQLPHAAPASEESRQRYRRDYGIVGDPTTFQVEANDVFLCALGSPSDRRTYTAALLEQGAEFIRLLHHTAAPSAYSSIAPGCILNTFSTISPDAILDRFVTLGSYSAVAHDAHIGAWTEIGGHCLIAGGVRIGEGVRIHPGCIVTAGARIGDGAIVAAGSVVFGRIPPGITVMGNPAKRFQWV